MLFLTFKIAALSRIRPVAGYLFSILTLSQKKQMRSILCRTLPEKLFPAP
jgi:hypothetical protein